MGTDESDSTCSKNSFDAQALKSINNHHLNKIVKDIKVYQ